MAVSYTANFQLALSADVNDLKASTAIQDRDDYGNIGAEEFERRIKAENDKRHGDVIRNAEWQPTGEAGW
ncbi:hypothetical protein [Agrobacterium vitis]|uniref:hypothetical protein n=1 Tax=Agrobacterium vitis TaxID=373 RepID=UPI001572BCC9|nr:hypothetical protein [Agrobacterium vitis]NSZ19026.1 hypothetical protein [Agrobacterium vitis]QZO06003.1 hypothetical protein K4831_20225 [Agrobacterium vitis]UJL90325.1 hypothetical protein AVF2S5_20260 [Agrobacterium vitis]